VPLNIFGGPDGFTREMADFAGVTGQESLYRKTYDYTASLAGELFDLPAGPLAFAIGYEHRREAGFDQPDALAATGATTGAVRVPTRGRFSVDEVHAELAIPVLRDVAFARALDVSIAARRSDYSNFGSTTSPALGFRWQPSRSVSLHGRYTEDFRAPSISELFGGASDSFPILADVCSAAQLAQLGRPDVLARCRNGIGGVLPVPPGYQQPSVQVRATVGGNPDLEPETGRSSALGLRYSPAWADGLQVHLGWHEVVVEDAIRASSAQFVMNDCYVGGRLRSCALITRSPSGDIVDLFHGAQNLPQVVESEGYDLLVDYRFETPVGSFKIDWQSTYLSYFAETWLTAEAGEPGSPRNRAGAYFDRGNVYHRLKSNIAANWRFGDWSANVTARYLSPLDEQCGLPVVLGAPGLCSDPDFDDPQFGGLPANELDETWYFDTQASWDSPWNARITAGVRNLLDADPPVSYATFAGNFDPSYEVPGRFWYLRYRQSF
jgi:iron complex outermembrane recepter protein